MSEDRESAEKGEKKGKAIKKRQFKGGDKRAARVSQSSADTFSLRLQLLLGN